jgi:DNA-binding MarR family transcriptional regulator
LRRITAIEATPPTTAGTPEKAGFIERIGSARGRGVRLFITEAGEAALAEAIERKEAFDHELAAALGEERHAELVRLLKEALPTVTALERGSG